MSIPGLFVSHDTQDTDTKSPPTTAALREELHRLVDLLDSRALQCFVDLLRAFVAHHAHHHRLVLVSLCCSWLA